MKPLVAALLASSFLVLTSCATGGERSTVDRNRISSEEIQNTDAGTLFELVDRLRPRWLRVRAERSVSDPGSVQVLVYEGNSRLGGVEELRGMLLAGVESLEYLDGATASATLPGIRSEHVAGAIIIHR